MPIYIEGRTLEEAKENLKMIMPRDKNDPKYPIMATGRLHYKGSKMNSYRFLLIEDMSK